MVEWQLQGKTPGNPTSRHLEAKQEDLGEGNYYNLTFEVSLFILRFLHAIKSYDLGPTAYLPSEGRRAADFYHP
jgi:hypothetical protein